MTMSFISTTTVTTTSVASIIFSNIPQDATDLLILVSARGNASGVAANNIFLQFNNVVTANYNTLVLQGSGTNQPTSFSYTQASIANMGQINQDTSTANTFANSKIYITNYANALTKSVFADGAEETNNNNAYMTITAGDWPNTAAIDSIKLFPYSGNFVQNTTASLYKITKGSDGITVVT